MKTALSQRAVEVTTVLMLRPEGIGIHILQTSKSCVVVPTYVRNSKCAFLLVVISFTSTAVLLLFPTRVMADFKTHFNSILSKLLADSYVNELDALLTQQLVL